MDQLYDLATSSPKVGLKPAQIRNLIAKGAIKGVQPGGPSGKWFLPKSELERLRTPAAPGQK